MRDGTLFTQAFFGRLFCRCCDKGRLILDHNSPIGFFIIGEILSSFRKRYLDSDSQTILDTVFAQEVRLKLGSNLNCAKI